MKDHVFVFVFVSVRLLVVFTLLLGIAYPAAVWAVGRVAFPGAASGSFVSRDGKVVGSELIGQQFDDPSYFWGRISATSTFAYNAFNAENLTASSGSNSYKSLSMGLGGSILFRTPSSPAINIAGKAK